MNNNRGTSRRRGRGNNRPQTSGRSGGMDQGNRIDSRARGNATQMLEKYKKMAHDAQMNGDRVATEYYLQFADHYFRVLADNRARQDEFRRPREDQPREQGSDYADDDFDNNGYTGSMGGPQGSYGASQDNVDDHGDGARNDNGQDDDGEDSRGNNRNDNRFNDNRRDRRPRDNRNEGRNDNRGDNRNDNRSENRNEGRNEPRNDQRPPRPRQDRSEPVQAAAPAPQPASDDPSEAPRRVARGRGRPPRAVESGEGNGLDPMILPPAIGIAPEAPAADSDAEPPKPKRRAAPRRKVADAGDVEAATAES